MEQQDRCAQCTLGDFCFHEAEATPMFKNAVAQHQLLDANHCLFAQGDPHPIVAVVQQGGIKLCQSNSGGQEQIIDLALPGDYVGLSRLFQDDSPTTAITLSRTRLCVMDPDILKSQAGDSSRLLKRELESIRWHQGLSLIEAPSRIAQWMLRLADYNDRRGISRSLIQLPLSRTDMANYLTMALETASRTLKRLERSELILIDGRQVEILDHNRLSALAYPPAAEKLRLA